jgi:periplasmic divalent cation tolerance protein
LNTELLTVFMTAPDVEVAERMGRILVEERLIACANVVQDVISLYRWEGEVQRDSEALVIMKTTADALPALEARAVELHPYDVPEVLAVPVVGGHGGYMDWVRAEVG